MAKKKDDIRVFSPELNKIILIKRFSDRSLVTLYNKLVRFIKNTEARKFDFIEYVSIVISGSIPPAQKKDYAEALEEAKQLPTKAEADGRRYRIMGCYYRAITDCYPELKIEYICGDINELLPESLVLDSILSDEEFKEEVTKASKGKRGKKNDLFNFSSLEHIKELEAYLKSEIIGQDEAVEVVCNAVKLKAAKFTDHINLFFIGKTGRGKTQLARKLGDKFSENKWIINCAEFSNGHEINRLLGSPPGYIGSQEGSLLKELADKGKRWTIIFDEIEKANQKLYNLLLALMDTGKCSDNQGNECDFSDSIFVFTSNCGLASLRKNTINWTKVATQESDKEEIMKSLEREFSPEFRGRIDEVVFFNDLTRDNAKAIAKIALKKYPVKVTEELVDYLVDKGYSEEYGARNINRFAKKLIALPLADEILSNNLPIDGSSKYDVELAEGNLKVVNTAKLQA